MRLVITGDKSRYQFFRYVVEKQMNSQERFHTENLEEMDVFVTSDKEKVVGNTFYSDKVPLNTTLFFPSEYKKLIEYNFSDRIIIFDEFPYGTEEEVVSLEEIIQSGNYGQLEVVLFQNDRSVLDSDISTDKMAIEEAEERYRNKSINVRRYRIGDVPEFLFWSQDVNRESEKSVFTSVLQNAYMCIDTFDSCYDLQYILDISIRVEDPMVLDSFFEYSNQLNGKNVWHIFYIKAFNYYFENNTSIEEFYINIYKTNISDFGIWDIEKDIIDLRKCVRTLFALKIESGDKLIYKGGKDDYDNFINCNKSEMINFKKNIINFFATEIKILLKQRIAKNIKKMEELLK